MPPILLLVGEDHQRATHAISRAGWLNIAQQLVNPDNPNTVRVVRALEETPNRAQRRNSQGYHNTAGLERETTSSGAYRQILKNIFKKFPPTKTAQNLKEAILKTPDARDSFDSPKYSISALTDIETSFQSAEKIIDEMDLRDLQTFFGVDGKEILEEWFKRIANEEKKNLLMQFCEDQLLTLSYTKTEIDKQLVSQRGKSFYEQLFFITNKAISGPAEIRHLENQYWVEIIKTSATNLEADIIIAFVGNEHLQNVEATEIVKDQKVSVHRPGLIELFETNMEPLKNLYVASNIREGMPPIPEELLTGSDSSNEYGSSEDSLISWPSDSEKEEPAEYEEYFIEQTLSKLRNTNQIILSGQDL